MTQAEITAQHRAMRERLAMVGRIPGGSAIPVEQSIAPMKGVNRNMPPDYHLQRCAIQRTELCEYRGCAEHPVATRWKGTKLLALCRTHSDLFDRIRA
jgi:hypothetical protein